MGVPFGTRRQISLISALETAMHPFVQFLAVCISPRSSNPFGRPWNMMSLPGFTPRFLEAVTSVT